MSYRKKRSGQRTHKEAQETLFSPEYTNSGELRMISTSKIHSGVAYQRPIDERVVDHLVAEWDARLLDPLAVSFRDGRFNLIDGQHRVAAMRKLNAGRDVMAPCMVYAGLTYEEEAELCYKLDKAKKRLSLAQSTNALIESGGNTDVKEIKKIMEKEGFVWSLKKTHGKDYEITATRAITNAYEELGDAGFARMLRLLDKTWHGDPGSLNAVMVSGLALFLVKYGNDFTDSDFSRRFSAFDPQEIVRRSKADVSTTSRGLRCARVLLEKYNSRRGGRKLAYRLQE